jgi:hypothetical protein
MQDIPLFQVIDGRIFASAKDKACLDRYVEAKGLPPITVEVVWESPQSLLPTVRRRLI